MIKHTFIYVVVFALVGITAWFFVQKSKNASRGSDSVGLAGLVATEEPAPTPDDDGEIKVEAGGSWTKLPNGLQLQDILVGYGREAREGDVVSAHYSGTLTNGQKFDNSYDRGQPFSFILGGGMVIKGWDLGLVGMKVGGKRKLIIPPELGYGSRDNGTIPPNSTLYFDVELMEVATPQK